VTNEQNVAVTKMSQRKMTKLSQRKKNSFGLAVWICMWLANLWDRSYVLMSSLGSHTFK